MTKLPGVRGLSSHGEQSVSHAHGLDGGTGRTRGCGGDATSALGAEDAVGAGAEGAGKGGSPVDAGPALGEVARGSGSPADADHDANTAAATPARERDHAAGRAALTRPPAERSDLLRR
jgi:hypothetical protein